MKKLTFGLMAILGATTVAAQVTGDWGRKMYSGGGFESILGWALYIGLVLLVWLWVVKLWKEVNKK